MLGVILGIIAIYLTFKKEPKTQKPINIAIILFLGAGILDMSLDYIEYAFLKTENDFNKFIIIIFFIAFLSGLSNIIYSQKKITLKNIIAGIILGVPNYFSIYFFLKSLDVLETFIVFPVLNIGVVLLSSMLGYIFYKEYLSRLNWIGVTIACISIMLILTF